MNTNLGKRVVDMSEVLLRFEAQEGEVEHIIGKTGQGKTYEATRRAAGFLFSGYTVYTTWKMHLPDYYDEREHLLPILRNIFLFRKDFYRFDLKNNYHYVDLRSFDLPDGGFDTERFSRYLAALTDCIFMLDEGQDVFDSHTKSGRIARQTITRTRHMHKTLIVISQRAQAVDVVARGNVSYFYKCEKRYIPFFGYRFRVYRTDEIDESSNYPIWVRHDSTGREVWKAELWYSAFAKKWIYDMYDSWYMRQQQIRSQDIKLEAFELSGKERMRTLWRSFFRSGDKSLDMRKYGTISKWAGMAKTADDQVAPLAISPQSKARGALSVEVASLKKSSDDKVWQNGAEQKEQVKNSSRSGAVQPAKAESVSSKKVRRGSSKTFNEKNNPRRVPVVSVPRPY